MIVGAQRGLGWSPIADAIDNAKAELRAELEDFFGRRVPDEYLPVLVDRALAQWEVVKGPLLDDLAVEARRRAPGIVAAGSRGLTLPGWAKAGAVVGGVLTATGTVFAFLTWRRSRR